MYTGHNEGYIWLCYVYLSNCSLIVDADIWLHVTHITHNFATAQCIDVFN